MSKKKPSLHMTDTETGEILDTNDQVQPNELIQAMPIPVKTQFNRDQFPLYHEHNDLPSLTVPDQALTIPQLLERHQRGLPMYGNPLPIYHGDEEMPDLRRMDLSEIADLKERTRQTIAEENERRLKAEAQRKKKQQEDFFEAEVQRRMKLAQDQSGKPKL